jgi:hypothetical protein
MIEPSHFAGAAARARVIASALALGRSLDLWSLTLVAVALLAGFLGLSLPLVPRICLLMSILAGGAQKIIALRVAFDAALFRHWAQAWASAASQGLDPAGLETDLATLDQVLATCSLRTPPSGPVRDLDRRLRGAWRLLRQQVLVFAMQLAAVLAALITMHLLPAD